MAGFNLTAQIQLQAPTNVSQVANQIKSQLGNVTTTVNVQSNAKSLAAINGQLQSVDKTAKNSAKSMNLLNRNIAEAARRFSVITVATGAFIGMARAIKNSVGAAIEFEREMVKISQVTGKSVKELKGLSDEVTRISTTMGVANASLLETARVLSQAGLSALKTKQAMEVLANTTLAPSFDNIIDTTEGAIAILNQFGREAAKTGQDIRFLEASLDAINAVSKNFAVESADLIGAIRRTGGVFQAAGGNLNELIALFTSVRQTTRESAETIATGFRTIFTRLQRTETIDALEQLGISLSDAEGKFVGPLKAVEALAAGLAGLDPKDVRFNEIVEQLGGFRQIGKVIPLIKQYAVAEQALAVANNSMGSTSKDAQTAQQSLAVQFQKVAESFDALMRKFTGSDTFQSIAKTVLSLADAFLSFASSLENVLPLLTSVAAIKLGKNLAPGLVSLFGGGGGGGSVSKFARGGFVPGTGNRDTVPAMLTPGEFVIKKSSAAKLGAAQLHAMNENRFNDGAEIREELSANRRAFKNVKGIKGKGSEGASVRLVEELSDDIKAKLESGEMNTYTGAFLRPEGRDKQVMGKLGKGAIGASINANERIAALKTAAKKKNANSVVKELNAEVKEMINATQGVESGFMLAAGSLEPTIALGMEETILEGVRDTVQSATAQIGGELGSRSIPDQAKILKTANIDNVVGNLFEASLLSFGSSPPYDRSASEDFDFPSGLGSGLAEQFGLSKYASNPGDAKSSFTNDNVASFTKKVENFETKEALNSIQGVIDKKIGQAIAALPADASNTEVARELGLAGKNYSAAASDLGSQLRPSKKATGGSVSGRDSVPSLLTPGEYVINKSAAQSIGYTNLHKMNKTGVAKFNKGGAVGIQSFANGGSVESGDFGLTSIKDLALVNAAAKKNAAAFDAITSELDRMNLDPEAQRAALVKFARSVDSVADEAELLDQAMLAAHRDITSAGPGAQRTGKKPSGAAGAGGIDDSDKGALSMFSGDEMAEVSARADALSAEFDALGEETRAGQKAAMEYRMALNNGIDEQIAYAQALEAGTKFQEEIEAESQKLKEAYASGAITEKELEKASAELAQKRKAAPTASGRTGGGGGGGGGPSPQLIKKQQEAQKKLIGHYKAQETRMRSFSSKLNKASGALSGVSGAAVGLTMIAGTLIQSMGNLDEGTKKVYQAGLNVVTSYLAIGAEIASLGLQVVASVTSMLAEKAARAANAVAVGENTVQAAAAAGAAAILGKAALKAAHELNKISPGEGGSDITDDLDMGKKTPKAPKGGKGKGGIGSKIKSGMGGGVGTGILAGVTASLAVAGGAYTAIMAQTAMATERFKQQLEAANKVGDAELEKIGGPQGGASEEKFVAARQEAAGAEMNIAVNEKVGQSNANIVAGSAAVVGSLAAVTTGLLIAGGALQAIPVVGNVVGLALIGLAGAAAAAGVAWAFFTGDAEEEARKLAKEQALLAEVSGGYARSTFRAKSGIDKFDKAMQTAKDNSLSAAASLSLLSNGVQALSSTYDDNADRIETSTKKRVELENLLREKGLLTDEGRVKEGGEPLDADTQDQVANFKELAKQEEEARKANNDLLNKLFQQESQLRQQMLAAVNESMSEMFEADPAALDGINDVTAFMNDAAVQASGLPNKLALAQKQIDDIIKKRFEGDIQEADDAGDLDLKQGLIAKRNAEIAVSQAKLNKQMQENITARKRMTAENLRSIVEERAKRRALQDSQRVIRGFNSMLMGATATAANFAQIENAGDVTTGGKISVEINSDALSQGLQGVTPDVLESAVQKGMNAINFGIEQTSPGVAKDPNEQAILDRTERIGARVKVAQELVNNIPEILEGYQQDLTKGRGIQAEELFDKINASIAGVDISKLNLGADIQRKIDEMLKESGTDRLTFEQVEELIGDIEEVAGADLEALQRAVEVQNQYLQKLQQINNLIIDAQGRYADAVARQASVAAKGRERVAKARGGTPTLQSLSDDADRRERDRNLVGDEALGRRARDAGARAGNVGANRDALKKLDAEAKRAEQNARDAAAAGDSEGAAKFTQQANEAGAAANRVRGELERLADQSAKAADIEAQLNQLRKERKQIGNQVEKFAFGSDQQRFDMGQSYATLNQAMAQGGIQGATEQQRAQVGGLLDQLSDVRIGPGGETGRELKAKFAEDEAIRMGMDPAIAKKVGEQVAAGSAEEQMVQKLEALAVQEEAAAAALAEDAKNQVKYLEQIAQNTKDDMKTDTAAAMQGTPEEAKQDKENAQKDKELAQALAQAETDLAAAEQALKTEVANLATATKNLEAATLKLSDLQDPDAQDARRTAIQGTAAGEAEAMINTSIAKFNQNRLSEDGTTQVQRDRFAEAAQVESGSFQLESGNNDEIDDMSDDEIAKNVNKALGGLMDAAIEKAKEGGASAEQVVRLEQAKLDAIAKAVESVKKQRDEGDEDTNYQNEMFSMGDKFAEALKTTIAPILKEIRDEAGKDAVAALPPNQRLARGGMVQYRNTGGIMNSIFKPKGTDTVPAMLTPGEFVIRKSAVDKIGVGTLSALNNGDVSSVAKSMGGPIYRAMGGVVNLPESGALQQAFISQLSGGKAGHILGALKDGFGMDDKEARKAAAYIKDLAKKGVINASNMQGGIQLENLNRAIRDSKFVSGILPTTFRPADFSAEVAAVDTDWPPTKAEFESVKKGLKIYQGRSDSLFHDIANMTKAIGGVNGPATKFAGSLLQRSGALKLNPAVEYNNIFKQIKAEANRNKQASSEAQGFYDKVKTLFEGTPDQGEQKDPRVLPWKVLIGRMKGQAAKDQQAAAQEEAQAEADAIKDLGLGRGDESKLKYLLDKNIVKMATGGSVAGSDTVPAMLTPGEFVMSKGSVQQYGTGFMSSLNRGRVPGFARGGLVGGVQYKQNGGEVNDGAAAIILDPSGLQEVLNNFNATFQSSIDSVVSQFSAFTESMNNLANAIQGGMTLTHNFSGDMSLAFKVENADHLKKVIADAITPRLSEIISSELDTRLNKDFRAG